MLNTLFNRIHIVTSSGDISDLYTEVVNNYDSGNFDLNTKNKAIEELYKRKRLNWHDFNKDLGSGSSAISGCTNSQADNYNPLATIDDGSCSFPSKTYSVFGDSNGDYLVNYFNSNGSQSLNGNCGGDGCYAGDIPNIWYIISVPLGSVVLQ